MARNFINTRHRQLMAATKVNGVSPSQQSALSTTMIGLSSIEQLPNSPAVQARLREIAALANSLASR
jgi:hypothetical protein